MNTACLTPNTECKAIKTVKSPVPTVTVGIMAHNEAENIGRLLGAITEEQRLSSAVLDSVVVVSSASTDGTDEIVGSFTQGRRNVELITEPKRNGKSYSINTFLRRIKTDLVILQSADTYPEAGSYEELLRPFSDPAIGMTGGRPIPVNHRDSFFGFTAHLLWEMHHRIASRHPKLGEMVAFRNIIPEIPERSAVDEVSLEALIKAKGYKLHYCPGAVVRNRGADNLKDFLNQRRRIACGHLWARNVQNYEASTMRLSRVLREASSILKLSPRSLIFTLGAALLESYARFLGWKDFLIGNKDHFNWTISKSTKRIII